MLEVLQVKIKIEDVQKFQKDNVFVFFLEFVVRAFFSENQAIHYYLLLLVGKHK
jgi:hypothetical protein